MIRKKSYQHSPYRYNLFEEQLSSHKLYRFEPSVALIIKCACYINVINRNNNYNDVDSYELSVYERDRVCIGKHITHYFCNRLIEHQLILNIGIKSPGKIIMFYLHKASCLKKITIL